MQVWGRRFIHALQPLLESYTSSCILPAAATRTWQRPDGSSWEKGRIQLPCGFSGEP